MRARQLKLIITFHTTQEAMAMEKACKQDGLPGRLIPVPGQIHAGCGLSWSTEPGCREEMKVYLEKQKLGYEAMGEFEI